VPVPHATALYGIAVTPAGTAAYATGTVSGGSGDVLVPLALAGGSVTPGTPVAAGHGARGIAITPDQGPIARLTVTPSSEAAGTPVTLDAAGSSNPSAPIASYTFDFGDGTPTVTVSAPATSTTHAYAVAGTYTATVTATDTAGTSTTVVYTGQTVSRNPGATASQVVTITPTVTAVNPAQGAAGLTVTITGTGFSTASGQTAFTFGPGGNTATDVVCASSTSCTATVPDGGNTVDVIATVNGQSSTPNPPGDQFEYGSAGVPTKLVTGAGWLQLFPLKFVSGPSATLTANGVPLPGQTLVFLGRNGTSLCTSVTDASGRAACPGKSGQAFLSGGFRVVFAGSPGYLPSSADGSLLSWL
jgi:hypothetical protein